MIVRCANCHTEFSLDDQQIGPEGATVRCSVCGYVFAVEPPPGVGDLPWQVRTVEDLLFSAPDLATLRAWIAEGRLHPDDQVSRTGRHWLRLGDMPEFSDVFSGFSDLPPVFEQLEDPPLAGGSALAELGPPPSFAGEMPVVQGVDTDILVVDDPSASATLPVGQRSRVTRDPAPGEDSSASLPAPPPPPSRRADSLGPTPFPLTELGVEEPADADPSTVAETSDAAPQIEVADESAVRMRPRPRPYTPTAKVAQLPDVPLLDDDSFDETDDEELPAGVPTRARRPTVLYGGSSPSSMLDAVTHQLDEEAALADSTEVVAPTAAAEERMPVRPREPSGKNKAASQPSPAATPAESPRPASASASAAAAIGAVELDLDPEFDEPKKRRSAWPLVAGLGLIAGVAVIFGVPSIRAKVMGAAGNLVGEPDAFDPASLAELSQAEAAMKSLDPAAVGEAEAALQARIDGQQVPPAGVAAMKLAQVELLATRSIEREIGAAVGHEPPTAGPADVERAGQILAGVVAADVPDGAQMRRVRARLRLAQGRPATEILPLLPEDESAAGLRALVTAAPLWRDADGPVPPGAIEQLAAHRGEGALHELALALAQLRAGDGATATTTAKGVLDRVAGHPTAAAIVARAGNAPTANGSDGEPGTEAAEGGSPVGESEAGSGDDGTPAEDSAGSGDTAAQADDGGDDKSDSGGSATPRPKTMSVDTMIERGCEMVESGSDVAEGLALLRKVKSRRPGDLDLQLCIGIAHQKQGRPGQALAAFERILARSPNFAPAARHAAKAAASRGDKEKAVKYYRKLLSVRPGDPTALAYVEKHGKPGGP